MVTHAQQKRMHMSMFMYTMSTGVDAQMLCHAKLEMYTHVKDTGVDAQMLCHAKLEMYTHVHAHARSDAQV